MVFLLQGEKAFQTTLMEAARAMGGLAYHNHDSRREVRRKGKLVLVGDADAKGYPDITIVTPDRRVIWAELKSGKKQPTETQWAWLRGLPDHQAYLWRPGDWDDAERIIREGHRQYEPTCIACNLNQNR